MTTENKLVPVECTNDMVEAASDWAWNTQEVEVKSFYQGIWSAMLAAAPSAPAETIPAGMVAALDALKWANEKLHEWGKSADFSLGMVRTLADSERREREARATPAWLPPDGGGVSRRRSRRDALFPRANAEGTTTIMTDRKITAIYGVEPHREGEYPSAHIVGGTSNTVHGQGDVRPFVVTGIERREENLGTYGVVWYDVSSADRVELSIGALAVAEVHYGAEVAA